MDLIAKHYQSLLELSYDEAIALPESNEVFSSKGCRVTIFKQALPNQSVLVTVQEAKAGLLGLSSKHEEKGIIFSKNEPPRNANQQELINTGG